MNPIVRINMLLRKTVIQIFPVKRQENVVITTYFLIKFFYNKLTITNQRSENA